MKYILSFMALCLVACQSANPYEDKTLALVPLKTFPLPKISVRAMQLLSDKNVSLLRVPMLLLALSILKTILSLFLTSKTKGLSLTFVR